MDYTGIIEMFPMIKTGLICGMLMSTGAGIGGMMIYYAVRIFRVMGG